MTEDEARRAELATFTPEEIDLVFGIGPFPAPRSARTPEENDADQLAALEEDAAWYSRRER